MYLSYKLVRYAKFQVMYGQTEENKESYKCEYGINVLDLITLLRA